MTSLKKWIRLLFGFSRRETNGFLVLIPLIVLIIFSQPIYKSLTWAKKKDYSTSSRILDSLVSLLEAPAPVPENKTTPENFLFSFDPNKADAETLQTLGLPASLAQRIVNYRTKGGRFSVKSDLMKIYGMDSATFKRLSPFIELPEQRIVERVLTAQNSEKAPPKEVNFDINTADSSQLIHVRGIGPVLASRIIRYRNRIGGFITKDQFYEVYGLDSSVVQGLYRATSIRDSFMPRKISLNELSEKELSEHPYISRAAARSIANYRFQHGYFRTVEDIRKIHGITDSLFLKIEPYLTIDCDRCRP